MRPTIDPARREALRKLGEGATGNQPLIFPKNVADIISEYDVPDSLYIVHCDMTTLMNPQTRKVEAEIPHTDADHVCGLFNADRRQLVLVSRGGNIHMFDTIAKRVLGAPLPVGQHPVQALFNPAGTKLFVINENSNNVAIVDMHAWGELLSKDEAAKIALAGAASAAAAAGAAGAAAAAAQHPATD